MNMIKGAAAALISSFLVALLFAYVFRFPIPLGGMIGPFGAGGPYAVSFAAVVQAVFVAWVFYGCFGGFPLVALLGAGAGYCAGRIYAGKPSKNRRILVYSAIAGAVPVAWLSSLDYFIGPW